MDRMGKTNRDKMFKGIQKKELILDDSRSVCDPISSLIITKYKCNTYKPHNALLV